eukprot:m.84590 g.84590  ORF g.84590 m.84590 type:complete len:326 (-) comp14691_c0_seq4:301-1278(-)
MVRNSYLWYFQLACALGFAVTTTSAQTSRIESTTMKTATNGSLVIGTSSNSSVYVNGVDLIAALNKIEAIQAELSTVKQQAERTARVIRQSRSFPCDFFANNWLEDYSEQLTAFGVSNPICLPPQNASDRPWLVFQQRVNPSNFYRNWDAYARGFGTQHPLESFWLGNNVLNNLTGAGSPAYWQMRVDLESFDGDSAFALHSNFSVGPASDQYRLSVTGYSGTAGNSFGAQNGYRFTTYDQDNDVLSNHLGIDGKRYDNCAKYYPGGYWYSKCFRANPNGIYYDPSDVAVMTRASFHTLDGTNWGGFKGYSEPLRVWMAIQPKLD